MTARIALLVFGLCAAASLVAACTLERDSVMMTRGPAQDAIVGADFAADLPENGMAIIDSPSNPLGLLLAPADLMRLSRACACVVVDERFAEYSGFSLLGWSAGAGLRLGGRLTAAG